MAKLHRESKGNYYFKPVYCDYTIHIYQINKHLWGWCKDRGATKGTFPTLTAARKYFGL